MDRIARDAIAAIGPEAIPYLIAMLYEGDDRQIAATAAGNLEKLAREGYREQATAAVPYLIALIDQEGGEQAPGVISALHTITRQRDLGPNHEWQKWWERQQ